MEGMSLPCTEPTATSAFKIKHTIKGGKDEEQIKVRNSDKFTCQLCNNKHPW